MSFPDDLASLRFRALVDGLTDYAVRILRIIRAALFVVVVLSLPYLSVGFVFFDPSPAEWHWIGRGIMAGFELLLMAWLFTLRYSGSES